MPESFNGLIKILNLMPIRGSCYNYIKQTQQSPLFLSHTETWHGIRKISPRLHSLGWLDWCPPDQSNTIRLGASVVHVSILRRSILWHFSDCNIRTLQRNSFPTQFRTWINYQQEKIFLCNWTSHELYNNNVFLSQTLIPFGITRRNDVWERWVSVESLV